MVVVPAFERNLLRAGAILAAALVAELAVAAAIDSSMALGLAQMVGLEVVAGRETGIPVALQAGAPPWLVAQVSFTQDLAVVSLLFPLALRSLAVAVEHRNWFGRRIARIDAAARRHQAWATRWGPLGVFAFMLIPFLANGPLVAAILGRATGIPAPRLVAPIVLATGIAIVAWTYAYHVVFGVTELVDPRLPGILTAFIVGLALGALLLDYRKERQNSR